MEIDNLSPCDTALLVDEHLREASMHPQVPSIPEIMAKGPGIVYCTFAHHYDTASS